MRRNLFNLPMVATLCIAAIVLIVGIGRSTDSRNHLTQFAGEPGPFDIIVNMPFEPEAFHLSMLQTAGRIAGVNGQDIHLKAVKLDDLRRLSWHPWVAGLSGYATDEPL